MDGALQPAGQRSSYMILHTASTPNLLQPSRSLYFARMQPNVKEELSTESEVYRD